MPPPRMLAAVDLGSNSFRLLIGTVESSEMGDQIRPLDSLKEVVRLAAGLDAEGSLDAEAQRRALAALHRFGERLRSFSPDAVRAVGTNTLRVARNARHFLSTAQAALGFPIEVIAGREEARLIYLGAAHALPHDGLPRLVVDIGGGSTECIVGTNEATTLLESVPVGCVSITRRCFPTGEVDRNSYARAHYEVRNALAPIARAYREHGWRYAVGTSGTAKALAQIAQNDFGLAGLTREGLSQLEKRLMKAGHADRIRLDSLRPDRRPVLAGGLAVMSAVFDELGVESMQYCPAALRQGVLYDLLGRSAGADMRAITVSNMTRRYAIDREHCARVKGTALALFDQIARGAAEVLTNRRELLSWSTDLVEIGMSVSQEDFHKHSSYILAHADMPGFSESEKTAMSTLVLGQVGGLRKMRERVSDDLEWLMVLSLRLASSLHRRRDGAQMPMPALFFKRRRVRLEMPRPWAQANPLSDQTFAAEALAWTELGLFDEFVYVRI